MLGNEAPDSPIKVYLEIGKARAFAGAVDWPGWCRSGRTEALALQALLDYGPRYARALGGTPLGFQAPADASALSVIERLEGNAATDFGVPAMAPAADARPTDDANVARFRAMLKACWQAFDAAAGAAAGKELRKGPRGGGRDLDQIVEHVLMADAAYLGRLGFKFEPDEGEAAEAALRRTRQAIREALEATARSGPPSPGPRGGVRWSVRYFVRRVTWHALDHAWEIEDRIP